jgi:hypothetical protein
MKIAVPFGSQIAPEGPFSSQNGHALAPLKTVADGMQILSQGLTKKERAKLPNLQSATAAWALYVSNRPEQRITSVSYDPENPSNRVPAIPLIDLPIERKRSTVPVDGAMILNRCPPNLSGRLFGV